MSFELVIFDCDGVLVDSETISCGTIAEMSTELGFPMTTHEAIQNFVGTSIEYVVDFLKDKITQPFPSDFESRYRTTCLERFQTNLQPIPGIEKVLNHLNIAKCVGSNGPRHKIISNLQLTNLIQYFDSNHLFSAYDIKKWKPLPDLYLHAANQMKINFDKCVVVEDSVAGVLAAREAGMTVYGYIGNTDGKALAEAGAKLIFSMTDLIQIL